MRPDTTDLATRHRWRNRAMLFILLVTLTMISPLLGLVAAAVAIFLVVRRHRRLTATRPETPAERVHRLEREGLL
jgi:hypothetical protein